MTAVTDPTPEQWAALLAAQPSCHHREVSERGALVRGCDRVATHERADSGEYYCAEHAGPGDPELPYAAALRVIERRAHLEAPAEAEPRSPLLEGAAARVVAAYEAFEDALEKADAEGHRVPSLKHPVGVRNAKDELDAAVEALEARLGHGRDNGPP